jgi:hypothetical protein
MNSQKKSYIINVLDKMNHETFPIKKVTFFVQLGSTMLPAYEELTWTSIAKILLLTFSKHW